MILTYIDSNNKISECTIAEAVQVDCSGAIDNYGVLENISENINAISRYIGILIQHLYEKGLIDKEVILAHMLQGDYEERGK